MSAIQIEARVVGRRKPVVPPWQLPISDEWRMGEKALCLQDLIVMAVTYGVDAFSQRQEQNQFLNVLTNRQTGDRAYAGRVYSETSLSTIEMRKDLITQMIAWMKIENVALKANWVLIEANLLHTTCSLETAWSTPNPAARCVSSRSNPSTAGGSSRRLPIVTPKPLK